MQVKVNDWNINYEEIGSGNPVIILHGWLANIETMRPLANNLSNNFKVYLVDVVGFGKYAIGKFVTIKDWKNFNWQDNYRNSRIIH